ncbi:MAG: biotin--[acetyl-CoA-carboxylase] ligase, partial [Chitinophagaceae bacterium]
GKQWMSAAGESLLMSLILRPNRTLQQQTQFMAAVAVSVAKICEQNLSKISVKIKWPNDIIIADKKAGGILIENMIRGTSWEWSVIGVGLNIQQQNFSKDLPFATSLAAHGAHVLELKSLAIELREEILAALASNSDFLKGFNGRLYQLKSKQLFRENRQEFWGRVEGMNASGLLEILLEDGQKRSLVHGEAEWVW